LGRAVVDRDRFVSRYRRGDERSGETLAARIEGSRGVEHGSRRPGFGLPLSYSYDAESDRIVVGLVDAPGSKKQRFAESTEEVTLTVYDSEDVDSWRSVLITGTIHPVDPTEVDDELTPLFFRQEDDATSEDRVVGFDWFDRTWYEIRIDEISGRHSGVEDRR
jgi:nitroimidazol reductase NimA-like FMN-containing flavoprotein (pyridoxamine 5'-phosphate oxidase superfamily)